MIAHILYLLFLAFLVVAAFLRYGDPLYPPFLQAGCWLVVMSVYLLSGDAFYPLSTTSYYLIANGVIAFAVGSLLMTHKHRAAVQTPSLAVEASPAALLFVFCLCLVVFPFFVIRIWHFGGHGSLLEMFVRARLALVENRDGGMGVLGYVLPVSNVSAATHLLMMHKVRHGKLRFTIATIIAFSYAFLSTGRTFILMLLVLLLGVALKTGKLTIRAGLLIGGAATVVVFVGIALITGKGANADASFAANMASVGHSIRIYMVGAIPAFDQFIRAGNHVQYGENTFRSVLAVTNKLGFDSQPVDLVKEYTRTPYLTNVYTVYRPYFEDFGFVGAAIVQLLFGMWHGYLYRKADCRSPFFICLYALFLYPLLLQFFQDQYFSLLSEWVQFTIWFMIVCKAGLPAVRTKVENTITVPAL